MNNNNNVVVKSTTEWKGREDDETLSIATFNTLRRNFEFSGKEWMKDEDKSWSNRLENHKKLFKQLDVDVLCLQEAEILTFKEDFGFLEQEPFDYSLIEPKAKDRKEAREHGYTKPSLAYRTSKLKVSWIQRRSRAILAQFEHIKTGKTFFVVNCHLQAESQAHPDESGQRTYQFRSAIQHLIVHRGEKSDPDSLGCFIVGDFNCNRDDPVHHLIVHGHLEGAEAEDVGSHDKPFQYSHPFKFKDSHDEKEEEKRFYTWKTGSKDHQPEQFCFLDYIYYTPKVLEVVEVRNPLTKEQREELASKGSLPNSWHSSDHLPVAAKFRFKK